MEIRRILSGRRPAQASLLLATEAGEPVSCTRCSRTFPTDPSTAVDCPVCRAGEGEPCRREPVGGFHRSHYTRAAIARRLGRMSECPALSWDGLHALPAPRAPRGPTPPATTKLEGNAR